MAITISDIAEKANVSKTTVSRVLNNSGYVKHETRMKIEKAINDLNYTPSAIARSLTQKTTNTIGVIVPDITNPYFSEIIKGISSIAEKYNLNIIFYNTDNNFEKELKSLNVLKEQRIQGIIMTPGFGADHSERYKKVIDTMNCPIVLASADLEGNEMNGVFVDNYKGVYQATKLLINEGHKKIGVMLGPLSSEPMKQRLKGYKEALYSSEISVNEKYIYLSDFTLNSAYELTKKILKEEDRPSALIISTNRMTIGVIKAFEELKVSIPHDMAVIGSDENELLDIFESNLSYLEEDPEELGKMSMEILYSIIKYKNNSKIIRKMIIPKIITNGSEKRE